MFHLLVAYNGWDDAAGTLKRSRVYIEEDDTVGSKFYSNGKLDGSKLKEDPALLVSETGTYGPQFARVANITDIRLGYDKVSIQYTIDNSIPTISNDELSVALSLGKYDLKHTCWTVYDLDLYKILLQNQQKRAISPKIFSLEESYPQDENLISIMMPFGAEFDSIYKTLEKATTSLGFSCLRADNIWEHHTIIQDIVTIIARAKVVICDCSGKNPNVFYEAGIAHAIGKEVIFITQSKQDVPFDLQHLRYIHYLPNSEGLNKLSESLKKKLQDRRLMWI